jgi:F-type H+-transporting ATPase subunit a
MMLGILVCIVQTLVFCILSTIYISMAISHGEH